MSVAIISLTNKKYLLLTKVLERTLRELCHSFFAECTWDLRDEMHLDSTWVGWIATRHAITHEVWSCFSNCNSIFENYTLGIRWFEMEEEEGGDRFMFIYWRSTNIYWVATFSSAWPDMSTRDHIFWRCDWIELNREYRDFGPWTMTVNCHVQFLCFPSCVTHDKWMELWHWKWKE